MQAPEMKVAVSAGSARPTVPIDQPFAVTIQMPPEKHDYAGDALSGGIGLVAGIIGAFVGAWAAYRFGLKAARKASFRTEAEKARHLRFSLTHKLGKIYSAQKDVRKACEEALRRLAAERELAAKQGALFFDHLSLELRPFATSFTRFNLSSDEVAEVGKRGSADALKIMMILDDRHNTTADLLDEYRNIKAEFEALVHRVGNFDPRRGYMHFAWSPEEYERLRPHLFKMDSLAEAIYQHSAQDERDAYKVIVEVAKVTAREGGENVDIRVTDPEGRIVKITSRGVDLVEVENLVPQEAEA